MALRGILFAMLISLAGARALLASEIYYCDDIRVACATDECKVRCSAGELIAALNAANACAVDGTYDRRIITVVDYAYLCQLTTYDPIYIAGNSITLQSNATQGPVRVNYGGPTPCNSENDAAWPPPFVVSGNTNVIRGVQYNFFPEGLLFQSGSGHRLENTIVDYYCDEAVTVQAAANVFITDSSFYGHMKDPRCTRNNANPGWDCGYDKTIQVNGGSSTIRNNRFIWTGAPIHVVSGSHVIEDNVVAGRIPSEVPGAPNPDNFCRSMSFAGGSSTVQRNRMYDCKHGIEVQGNAMVNAVGNVVKDSYASAFTVRDQGRLRATGNVLKGAGWHDQASCRGALVASSGSNAKVDFGGGDCQQGIVHPAGISPGQNLFCQGPNNSRDNTNHVDIRNADGDGCGAGAACMRAASNCFDNGVHKAGTANTPGDVGGCACSSY